MTRPDHVLPSPEPTLRASVIIPARDEAEILPAALAALARQGGAGGLTLGPRSYEVIVLANNCTDDTAARARRVARAAADRVPIHVVELTFPPEEAHVGTARRWLMDAACDRLESVGQPRGLIASTDADSEVARDWVAASLAAIDAGAAAVAGMIRIHPGELRRVPARVRRGYLADLVYRRLLLELETLVDPNPLDPSPPHDFHGGASFGITPVGYRLVGGLPPLASLEDVALVEALWRADARLVHDGRVRVRTSARLLGRAAGGFSQALARWAGDTAVRVRGVRQVEAELSIRRQLRECYRAGPGHPGGARSIDPARLPALADRIGVAPSRLGQITTKQTFGQWLDELRQVRDIREDAFMPVPIDEAIAEVRSRVRVLRSLQASPPS